MKKLLFITLMACSFSFARFSTDYVVVVSPAESYLQKKQLEFSKIETGSDYSVQWKRRHARRKKMRRPQRGR
tara:strand:- start:32 stop:247 length:216 start_codon:yes stop_codon:yes gene_type:complete